MAIESALGRLDRRVGAFDHLASPTLRIGLGITIFLAGAHKLVAPAAWHAYLAPLIATVWPTAIAPLDPVFVLFGVSEVLFGGLLLANYHTPTVAALTALSLVGVVINLAIAIVQGEPFVDVLIRDLGLAVFAFGVAFDAART